MDRIPRNHGRHMGYRYGLAALRGACFLVEHWIILESVLGRAEVCDDPMPLRPPVIDAYRTVGHDLNVIDLALLSAIKIYHVAVDVSHRKMKMLGGSSPSSTGCS
jgi:hypothetical protein